ncbi:chondroitin AC/alginate lyase family protein (PL 8) [Formosa agariphila KMM 3901]|uniref:Chondroitin AC/alginate lyase family protein (PL 8) n=1 Tax=Formosa agariphila (strain DSM 15362 / KCTC 12365 / LMG 23005 / KMM 3901 / M-2Alg 35-1) TaxID=1347342 RepID=T2KIW6_FORAG|nr:hypothetical protein [Formosa agariphila]CDF78745.1 chondroitin AC/alginate lyase family protein (PL 8) [Formosa agariphila KMM 3901]
MTFKKISSQSPLLVLVAVLILATSCNSQSEKSLEPLNIKDYLELGHADTLYPSPQQMELLKKAIPEDHFQPAPKISDRSYWDQVAASVSGQAYLKKANTLLDSKPEVPITDSIYRLANKDGNRKIYKPRYYRTMDRLEHFVLAECIENKGRFLPQIKTFSDSIMAMKSWVHPNHDDKNNGILEGRRVSIDLGARKFGSVLALAESLLEDKIPQELRNQINENLQRRITDTYLKSTEFLDINNTWIKSTSNWNSVCTSGAVLTIITNSDSYEKRLAAVGSAINSMTYYLSGFGDDGYCSEGLGYWGYGFGHYLYLAQILHDYSNGNIDLFKFDNPEKLRNVGNFPENFEIQSGRCAPFADGVSSISSSGSNFANVLSAEHYGAIVPNEIRMEEAAEQLIAWNNPELFKVQVHPVISELPNHTYYNDFGMVISRGKQAHPFSIALKAGHNDENHNHSDVGTYTLVLGSDIMSGDIGAPSYMAGSFSPKNKARSSWGHPVPLINNTLQSNGKSFKGVFIATNFSDTTDHVVVDIKPAYELPMLETLERTMTNDKRGKGTITVEDYFLASEPVAFETTIMTLNNYEIIDNNTVILTSENKKVKAEVKSEGFNVTIKDIQVPVKHLREGGPAFRIGIKAKESAKSGKITIIYTPL